MSMRCLGMHGGVDRPPTLQACRARLKRVSARRACSEHQASNCKATHLGVPNVQVAVGLRREASHHLRPGQGGVQGGTRRVGCRRVAQQGAAAEAGPSRSAPRPARPPTLPPVSCRCLDSRSGVLAMFIWPRTSLQSAERRAQGAG